MCYLLGNSTDSASVYAESFGQLFRDAIRFVSAYHSANFLNLLWRKFCGVSPYFRRHILHVVRFRAQKQMGWINARWIVATMEYAHPVWNWTVVNRPRKTVGVLFSTWIAASEQTVTHIIPSSDPNPAFSRNLTCYLFPKTFNRITRFWHKLNVAQLAT